jgi:hypothetical protein
MADGLPATACPSSRTRNEGKFRRGRGYTSWIPDRLPENEGQVDRETLGQQDLGCHAARVSGIPALGELRFDLAEFGDGIAFVGVVVSALRPQPPRGMAMVMLMVMVIGKGTGPVQAPERGYR